MTASRSAWSDLPGGEILEEGLEDLRSGRETAAALLLRIAAPRLERLGIVLPARSAAAEDDDELVLYRLLRAESPRDAYGRYNASLRRLVSLCQTLELRAARARRLAGE